MKARMQMALDGFGESTNKQAQELITAYNRGRMSIRSLTLLGVCTWSSGGSHQHTLEFEREGYKCTQSCAPGKWELRCGVSVYGEDMDDQLPDSYYMMGLAVFDPKDFEEVEPASLDTGTRASAGTMIDVLQVSGKQRLYRVDLMNRPDTDIRVDFSWQPDESPPVFPVRTQVQFCRKGQLGSSAARPQRTIWLEVKPSDVTCNCYSP
jgi:hypothetical protein